MTSKRCRMGLRSSIGAVLMALMCSGVQAQTAQDYAALIRAEKSEQAEKLANAALAKNASDPVALAGKVSALLARQDNARIEEAVKIAQQCVDANPQAAGCHNAKGNALGAKAITGGMLSAMSYATQIRDAFKTAVELDPKAVEPRVSLLQYYLQAPGIVGGGKDKARALAEDTRKVSVPAASLMQATLLMSDEKLREAEPLVLQLNPGDDELLKDLHRGTLVGLTAEYVRTKLFTDAQRIASELARRYPNNVWAAYGQGRVLQETNKCGEAIAHFERALTLEKPFAAVHYRLAQCYQAQGDKPKAISALERALAFKPAMGSKQRKEAETLLAELKT